MVFLESCWWVRSRSCTPTRSNTSSGRSAPHWSSCLWRPACTRSGVLEVRRTHVYVILFEMGASDTCSPTLQRLGYENPILELQVCNYLSACNSSGIIVFLYICSYFHMEYLHFYFSVFFLTFQRADEIFWNFCTFMHCFLLRARILLSAIISLFKFASKLLSQ